MTKKQMTIEEVKNKKLSLETEILQKLRTFENSSDIQVDYVSVRIDCHSYEEEEDARKKGKQLRALKGILDVQINAAIDNDVRSVDLSVESR